MGVMMSNTKLSIRLAFGICAATFCCVCLLALPSKAEAAFYKCTDANGNVSYNQTPCAAEEKAETILNVKSKKKAPVNCRIANSFARQIAMRMRTGQSSGVVFDSYGGIDAIPRSSVGIISYVYSHLENVNTGPERITALSAARCTAGSYGKVGCDDFPFEFIAQLGGCDSALMGTPVEPVTNTQAAQQTPPVEEGTTQALGAKKAADQRSGTVNCQQKMEAQLSELFSQMRAGQSANEQNQLESRKKQLREQLTNC